MIQAKKIYPCGRLRAFQPSRRELLTQAACGFGSVALAALAKPTFAAEDGDNSSARKANGLHHRQRAKNIIFLYMDGGPSQMDTFDPKPRLTRENGQPFAMKKERTQFDNNGTTLGSPWKFQQYGESGIPISELFPHVARHADRLCVVRSLTSDFSEHTSANYFLHTGHGFAGRPSLGAWATYGLGSECENLPGYVVLNGGLTPPGGLDNFASGFLPADYQASLFGSGPAPIANLSDPVRRSIPGRRDLLRQLDRQSATRMGDPPAVEAAIRNYEMAFAMQTAVPDLVDLSAESQSTLDAYGVDSEFQPTAIYGRQCLLARRLVERGVRFVELTCPSIGGNDRWDQHSNLKKGHEENARAVDQPIAALLGDLASRGLLEQTLVVFAGEFGRTPFAQGNNGRDHNPFGFTVWMAGGGVAAGTIYGATDEYGYKAVENPLQMHDLHAMMLYQMGIDHRRLTFRFGGRDMRLTDVHGRIIPELVG
jgi:hypothetical protein